MSTEMKETLCGTIHELLLILKEIDLFIDAHKPLNRQLSALLEERNKLQELFEEMSGHA